MNDMWKNPRFWSPSFWPETGRDIWGSCSPWDICQAQAAGMAQAAGTAQAGAGGFWMPAREEDWETEQDIEYFLEMCPAQVRAMERHVENLCDRFEYDGSLMYDVWPDRVTMMRLKNMVLKEAEDDPALFGETGYFGEPGGAAASDMAEILLYHEITRRRRRRRGRR